MAIEELVEGDTEPVTATLKYDVLVDALEETRAFRLADLTGCTVALKLADKDGNALTPAGVTTVVTPLTGKVQYARVSTELVETLSPYQVRWQVTDGAGKKSSFPTGVPDQWVVRKP